MDNGQEFRTVECVEWHKGFYNDEDCEKALSRIHYSDYFEEPDDEFPYHSAWPLLCGSCEVFALSLHKFLNYDPYIILGSKKGFHAFCQVYKDRQWYFIDARGVTTSFDEFMKVARSFVDGEFTIRPVSDDDKRKWAKDCEDDNNYDKEAYAFAEAVIEEYREFYTL